MSVRRSPLKIMKRKLKGGHAERLPARPIEESPGSTSRLPELRYGNAEHR
jgi:hypothetical protein